MLRVALTGNIASGKSTVAALFERWGATLIDADRLVREAQAPGGPVLQAIAARFGPDYIGPDGALRRDALRRRVMGDPTALAELNRIVHPEVHRRRAALEAAASARGDRIVISDIPLLFEAADPSAFDAIVLVDAPEPVRRARLIAERGSSGEEADQTARGANAQRAQAIAEHISSSTTTAISPSWNGRAAAVWEALLARA